MAIRQNIALYMKRNEKLMSSLALLVGFLFDSFTLRRADLLIENIFLLSYVVIVAFCIVKLNTKPRPWNLILMQFCLGNLFSAFFIFYSRSASFVASWPFLLLLLLLMIVNERLREKYARLAFQVMVFFSVLFSYAIFLVPIILKQLGTWVFILSGAVSLFFISLFWWILRTFSRESVERSKNEIVIGVVSIYVILNIFYFTNIIPPIPLALKDIGIYSSVSRNADGSFALVKGEQREGVPVYAYSSVFAPIDLKVKIYHVWEYFDGAKARWVTVSRVPFQISGGRDDGFRGYSVKSNIFKARWRVNVETEDGKQIGRTKFLVK